MFVHGLPPIVSNTTEILILGTMPGRLSLERKEYYAHPRNLFWQFIEDILNIRKDDPYEQRCERLQISHVGLWDILKTCTRESSLDSDIDENTIVCSDLDSLLRENPNISKFVFNGKKAESLYRKYVASSLVNMGRSIRLDSVPSSSPANASISMQTKRQKWKQALNAA